MAQNTTGKTPQRGAADVFHGNAHPLDPIFNPKSVAVVGASEREGSVGRTVLWNLLSSPFGGTIYPVNAKRSNLLGVRAYPSIKDLPEVPDLVVVCTPASAAPALMRESVELGVPGAIIISAGFKEAGPEGVALEKELDSICRGKLRLVGPNCLGVMNPIKGLNATFAATIAKPGSVAFISQSGALCTAVLDWSLRENVGFSSFVSMGSMLDVNFGDLIDYYGNDPRTNAIVMYMESIGDARSFLSAAREVSLTKPVIVIKAGRTAAAAKAAASHTGSLTGSDDVLDAAFSRTGVLRVDNISDIFNMVDVLSKQPLPNGNRLCIVTNAGGPGVLATDALCQGGGELAGISPASMEAYNKLLPSAWSHNNPVDILGDAEPERYAKSLEIAAQDPDIDGMMVIMTPQGMTNPTMIAEHLKPYAHSLGKPIVASWMGGGSVAAGAGILNQAGIPAFNHPDTACRAFNYMWKYAANLKSIYETPQLNATGAEPNREAVKKIFEGSLKTDRTILTEYESKKVLEAYNIPTTATEMALSEDDAEKWAEKIGYPVVLKLYSFTITHKSDVGGVKLNLRDAASVRKAYTEIKESVTKLCGAEHFQGVTVQPMAKLEGYEIILGASLDPQFGPVLLFGTGGQLVEVYKDKALALPPLNTTLARRMMEQTKVYHALKGVRGRKSVDMNALEQMMVRFSELVIENPRIAEIDINPLLASSDNLIALDARVVLHPASVSDEQLPKPAIHPYPVQYVGSWKAKDGEEVVIRPIRPEDEPKVVEFHKELSDRTVYLRYSEQLNYSQRVSHERLTRICFIDYDREMALVAERKTKDGSQIIAVGRLSKLHGKQEAELACLVSDKFQGKGIGAEIYKRLIQVASDSKMKKVHSDMLWENEAMKKMCKNFGFVIGEKDANGKAPASLDLTGKAASAK